MNMINSALPLTPADIQAHPRCIAGSVRLATGQIATLRPLEKGDSAILGAYFLGLSEDTKRRYGPHPFDQATADQFCANIQDGDTIRMLATIPQGEQEQVLAYFIFVLGTGEAEGKRYAALGIALDPALDCTLAPSVADAYQNTGLGSLLMRQVKEIASALGRRWMVLMGGVFVTNERAVHFYEKHGFRKVGGFENSPGLHSYDMILELSQRGA